jgi:hypothetical protein
MAVGTAGVDVDVDRDANRHGRCVDELVALHLLRVLGCGRGALAAGNFVCGSELGGGNTRRFCPTPPTPLLYPASRLHGLVSPLVAAIWETLLAYRPLRQLYNVS